MQTVRQLLTGKDKNKQKIVSVQPDDTVYQALQVMAECDIGAVLVMQDNKLQGIFSERDYARRIVLKGKTSTGTYVRDSMTTLVLTVSPDKTIDECMALMTNKHIRHLPVFEDETVIGLLSIGDLVKATIEAQKQVIDHLVSYIQTA